MQSRDYYFASLYILAYLTLVRILDFLFSFLSFDIKYTDMFGTINFTVIASTLFFVLLSIFAVHQIFKKKMIGFYSGLTLYGLWVISTIILLIFYSTPLLGYSPDWYLIGPNIVSLITTGALLYILLKSKKEFK
ncbi:MAG: hypothetical protein ABIH20_05185 [Candidatus Diapherotrites archaeon]